MSPARTASAWLPEHVAGIARQTGWEIPLITASDVAPIVPDRDVWDMWHIQHGDGRTVILDGRSWWFFLAAPVLPDPDMRHDKARIRLTSHGADGWRDHGETFADGFTPGSREWSGSSILGDDGILTMYFTASGRRGGPRTMEQRLFESRARFAVADGAPRIGDWSVPVESIAADGRFYAVADQPAPVNDRIKGFRDPGYFRDPADGVEYLLFVGSAGWTDIADDGVIGVARRDGGHGWTLAPPIVTALGVNNELERPHVAMHAGRYYLFWSTQAARFSPACPEGVTGLYAMVADRMAGPWRPVNGTALIAGNPRQEPFQGYCWWVTAELEVASFVDAWGLHGRDPRAEPALRRAQFGGTVAPWFRLAINGDRVTIARD